MFANIFRQQYVVRLDKRKPCQYCWPKCSLKKGQHVGKVCHTITTSNMAEKESAVRLLHALFVDDEEEKARGPTETASLNLFLISRSSK